MKWFKNTGNLIILAFIGLALSMLYFAFKAMSVPYEMAVQGDYYQEEANFNKRLEAQENALELGEQFYFKSEGNKLTLAVPKDIAANFSKGEIQFFCLSDSHNDSKQTLTPNTDGVYIFDRSQTATGNNYIVKVSFRYDDKDYYKEFRMM